MARNVGARGVTTDWILFADSDCYVDAAGFERAWTVLGARSELDGLMGVGDARGPEDSLVGTYRNFRIHHDTLGMENPPAHLNSSYFLEYDSAFRFFHDKPMSLVQFACEACRRAAASSLNAAGKARRAAESISWAPPLGARLLAMNAALLSIPASLFAGWPAAATVLLVLAFAVLAGPPTRMVSTGCRSFGPRFAAAVVLLHWVELLAATVGVARALPGLMRRGKGLPA